MLKSLGKRGFYSMSVHTVVDWRTGSEVGVQIPPGAPTDSDVALPSLIFFRMLPQSHRGFV
jgi:hypothetical protein